MRPLTVAVVSIALTIIGCGGTANDLGCAGFSLDEWRHPDSGENFDRYEAARALSKCDSLHGKTPAEVERVLGKASYRNTTRRGDLWLSWTGGIDYLGDEDLMGVKFKRGTRATLVQFGY